MKPIIIVMGVSGSGKSTLGKLLVETQGGVFIEGDDFHTPMSVAKMKAGEPLTDDDRAEWLVALSRKIQQADERLYVLSCSALKAAYRELLRLAAADPERVQFVFLNGAEKTLRERLENRSGHFMSAEMLQSQLDTLEAPTNALELDIALSPAALVAAIEEEFLN